jgi:hypothetical protein
MRQLYENIQELCAVLVATSQRIKGKVFNLIEPSSGTCYAESRLGNEKGLDANYEYLTSLHALKHS